MDNFGEIWATLYSNIWSHCSEELFFSKSTFCLLAAASKKVQVHFFNLKKFNYLGCRHSSVDSSAPSILPPRVRLPSMPSTLFSIIVKFVLYLSMQCEKRTKINRKEAGFGPFFLIQKSLINCNVAIGKLSSTQLEILIWFENTDIKSFIKSGGLMVSMLAFPLMIRVRISLKIRGFL